MSEKTTCRAIGPIIIDGIDYFLIPWDDLKKCKIEIIVEEERK